MSYMLYSSWYTDVSLSQVWTYVIINAIYKYVVFDHSTDLNNLSVRALRTCNIQTVLKGKIPLITTVPLG